MKLVPKRSSQFEVLRRIFLFDHVKVDVAEFIFASPKCECFEYESKEPVYTRSEFRKCLGVVVSGELKAIKAPQEGVTILLNTFRPGDIFGAASLFHESSVYVSEIQTVTRSRVLFLPEELLRVLFRREPVTAENYIAYLSGRIAFLNSRIDFFTGGSARQRFANFMLSVCPQNGPYVYSLPFSYTELAEMLNIGRASLYRAMDSLQRLGVLQRSERELAIIDPDVLRRIVSENADFE